VSPRRGKGGGIKISKRVKNPPGREEEHAFLSGRRRVAGKGQAKEKSHSSQEKRPCGKKKVPGERVQVKGKKRGAV